MSNANNTAPSSYIVSHAEKLCSRLRRDELGYMVQAGVLDDLLSAVDLLDGAMRTIPVPSEAIKLAYNSALLALDIYCADIEADLDDEDREARAARRGDVHATGDVHGEAR